MSPLNFRRWLLALLVVNLLVRLPLCWDPAVVDNDGAEYLAIARHLRTEGRYATDLKWQFFTDDPVRHMAWADRPPAYPVFAVLCQRALFFLDPTAAARVGNALLALGALVLTALYLRRLFGPRTALLATGYVFLLPHTLKWTTQPMTETLTLALTFAGLLAWDGWATAGARDESGRRWLPFLAGGCAGLAYLARPSGGVLLAALLVDGLWRAPGASPGWGGNGSLGWGGNGSPWWGGKRTLWAAGTALAGFGLFAAPYHGWLAVLYGSPTYSALGFTFAVHTYYEVAHYGFEASRSTTAEFLRRYWFDVPGLVLHQIGRHVQLLLPQLAPFLLWTPGLRRKEWVDRRFAGMMFVLLLAIVHTVTWAAWGSSRYFLAALPIVVALLIDAGERRQRNTRPVLAVTAVGLVLAVGFFFARHARPDRGLSSLPAWRQAAEAVRDVSIVASDKPSILNLLLEVPAVRLPRTTDPSLLERFVVTYRPEALVLFADEVGEAEVAAAWRAGALPAGWRLEIDHGILLIARPERGPGNREGNPGGVPNSSIDGRRQ